MKLIAFWLIAAVLASLALAVLLPPLLGRRRNGEAPSNDQVNAAVYQARLKELENEVDLDALDPGDLAEARLELERELLSSMESATSTDATARPGPRQAAVAIAILLPLIALGVYLKLGAPEAIIAEPPVPPTASSLPAPAAGMDRAALERMVATFAERLTENPDQGDGWIVLGQAYVMLEDYDAAVLAFAHAQMLLGETPDLLVDFAEAEALSNQNRFSDSARGRIEKALELNADHQKGLWLGAFAAVQYGDTDVAVSRWRRLLEQESDAQRRHIIEGLIARVQADDTRPEEAGAATPASAARVHVRVALPTALRAELNGSETVFIFARAEKGPKVPLAVYRTRVDALPAAVTLDDSMAMSPTFTLSGQERVIVTARVSMSGNAQAQTGDLQGQSGPITVGAETPVDISIDQQVP